MRMEMPNAILLHPLPDVDGLIKTKKIRLSPPFLHGFARSVRYPPLAQQSIDLAHKGILVGQVMDLLDELFVPILFRFVNGAADRVDMNFNALAPQLCDLAITKGLAKRRKSLKEIGDFTHGKT